MDQVNFNKSDIYWHVLYKLWLSISHIEHSKSNLRSDIKMKWQIYPLHKQIKSLVQKMNLKRSLGPKGSNSHSWPSPLLLVFMHDNIIFCDFGL